MNTDDLLRPSGADELTDDQLEDQLTRWVRLQQWTEASWFAEQLADRSPGDPARVRRSAELAERAGQSLVAARMSQRLSDCDTLDDSDWWRWVYATLMVGANSQARMLLHRSPLARSPRWDVLDFACGAWRLLRQRALEDDQPEQARDDAARSWEPAFAMVDVIGDADATELSERARHLAARLLDWLDIDHRAGLPVDVERVVATVKELGRRYPSVLGRAAVFLLDHDLDWVLAHTAGPDADAEALQARLVAHARRAEHELVLEDGVRLRSLGVEVRDLPVVESVRMVWVRALAEVGRLKEASAQSQRALDELVQLDEEQAPGPPTPTALAVNRLYYEVERGRTYYQRAEFDRSWPCWVAAARTAPERCDEQTRLYLYHLGVATAPDPRTAAVQLRRAIDLTRTMVEQDRAGLIDKGDVDTTLVDTCLAVATRWEPADGDWSTLAAAGLQGAELDLLSNARNRGLVLARELLSGFADVIGPAQRMRLALLAADELMAEALAEELPDDSGERWDGRVLRAVLELQCGRDREALELLRAAMRERRHDLDLRVLYAHAALLADEVEEAAQEALEIVEMAPCHTMARVVRAECTFELAVRGEQAVTPSAPTRGGGEAAPDKPEATTEASAMESVQELIAAVADYHAAARLDDRLKKFLVEAHPRPDGPPIGGSAVDGRPLGSDLLTPRQVMQVCRRGLHAAVIAQEGIDRLGLRRDQVMEHHAAMLIRYLRANRPACACATCRRHDPTWLSERLHRVAHLLDRDEASRLAHLLTGYRWAHRRRRLAHALVVLLGALMVWVALRHAPGAEARLPGLAEGSVRATVLAFGLVLVIFPFVRTVKLGSVELTRPDRAPPISGRSKALRASAVLQRNALLSTTIAAIPNVPTARSGRGDGAVSREDQVGTTVDLSDTATGTNLAPATADGSLGVG